MSLHSARSLPFPAAAALALVSIPVAGCSGPPSAALPSDAGVGPSPGDSAPLEADGVKGPQSRDPGSETRRRATEGAFVDRVVRFLPGVGAGFGSDALPWVVQGGPRGEGTARGSLDVLSLGTGGSLEVAFDRVAVVDGEGADFLVFENAFRFGPAGARTYAEWARVSVSDDGVHWVTFPCDAITGSGCAGGAPVFANVTANDLEWTSAAVAGGDPFDLADVGLSRARFFRIDDQGTYPVAAFVDGKAGFDLDAIAALHVISVR